MISSLPSGEQIAEMQISLAGLFSLSPDFTGYIRTEIENTDGCLLVENGKPVAGSYIAGDLKLSGSDAYRAMLKKERMKCILNTYRPEELESAKAAIDDNFVISEDADRTEIKGDSILSPETLLSVMRQPGVIAASVFFEGFALQSAGDADFEHVAAVSEDLVRTGAKMTDDLMMGELNQLLLETDEGKLIVTPARDLFICILAEKDANLGLIRLALQKIRYDLNEENS
ncbi:roadblock/LC7 domain-containing protein [Methanoplanus endosymbiosus]|uniref:Roadblock/LC7 domain-containing protein n=1 Tax=Methanoplanus endosymbiosus TaxID=33865 RepID=A0A9E7TLD2_9EURY|nr:roadblock/LC7 domain-containing protein [Methanoplanus endosymbiosus]UUX93615.1 roadblock/LC7 domain-containing protein [Methanoplanus endosymbiosus]